MTQEMHTLEVLKLPMYASQIQRNQVMSQGDKSTYTWQHAPCLD